MYDLLFYYFNSLKEKKLRIKLDFIPKQVKIFRLFSRLKTDFYSKQKERKKYDPQVKSYRFLAAELVSEKIDNFKS